MHFEPTTIIWVVGGLLVYLLVGRRNNGSAGDGPSGWFGGSGDGGDGGD